MFTSLLDYIQQTYPQTTPQSMANQTMFSSPQQGGEAGGSGGGKLHNILNMVKGSMEGDAFHGLIGNSFTNPNIVDTGIQDTTNPNMIPLYGSLA